MMEFAINTTWDSRALDHKPISVKFQKSDDYLKISAEAPFFDDPRPSGGSIPGQPYDELWNYEVVEAFFLSDDDKYLEVEFSPHGQHLVLLLNGCRNPIKSMLPLEFNAAIDEGTWVGEAFIPLSYFPPNVKRFNAYAIHGIGDQRIYESLYPVPAGIFEDPDFHRLDYFKSIDFDSLVPGNDVSGISEIWRNALQNGI
ncbi:C4orf33 (predicted) [Pycnogonum litorale]